MRCPRNFGTSEISQVKRSLTKTILRLPPRQFPQKTGIDEEANGLSAVCSEPDVLDSVDDTEPSGLAIMSDDAETAESVIPALLNALVNNVVERSSGDSAAQDSDLAQALGSVEPGGKLIKDEGAKAARRSRYM